MGELGAYKSLLLTPLLELGALNEAAPGASTPTPTRGHPNHLLQVGGLGGVSIITHY